MQRAIKTPLDRAAALAAPIPEPLTFAAFHDLAQRLGAIEVVFGPGVGRYGDVASPIWARTETGSLWLWGLPEKMYFTREVIARTRSTDGSGRLR